MSKRKIRVAVAGVGSCASSLIQGIQFYTQNPDESVGLTYREIGGYTSEDMSFVTGFDVDDRKVGQSLRSAIFSSPNNVMQPEGVRQESLSVVDEGAIVHRGPTLDGISEHMRSLPHEITFVESNDQPISSSEYQSLLREGEVDVLLNYMPVGAEEASRFYIENAIQCGVHIVNCMPSYISTESSKELEKLAILHGVTIIGSDMRSCFGASRLSEVLQGSMLDSGLMVTQHIQENKSCGTTQGQENLRFGRSSNTDFGNMAMEERLKNKHISKENVLNGQSSVRNKDVAGMTMYAGPSLVVQQKPGGRYLTSDNKVANLDIVAYGWAGARYELFARLSVQDSPNSGAIVFDAIRFCKVAQEMGIVGYLRGASAWTQKTPPVQMRTADSKFECDALARRILTPMTEKQLSKNSPRPEELEWTEQPGHTDYE